MNPMNATEWETLIAARQALVSAGHGAKRSVTTQAAAALGCSTATLYRKLEAAGLDTGRKRRMDAGSTQMTLDDLRLISGVLWASRRDNDKQLWGCDKVLDNLRASGRISTDLSAGRVMTLLREHHLHPQQLAAPRPTVQMQSRHPNHLWQIDSSTSVLYKDKSGLMRSMASDEFYKNKASNFARVANDLITRYLAVDHASGAFKGRYYLGGESADNLVDFFLWAIAKQSDASMHGVPLMLYTDQGPGNKSKLFVNLCRNLKVDLRHHEAGRANATGSVEKHGDIWERHVEGGFRFFDRSELTLDFINGIGCEWAVAYCAKQKHTRHGEPRHHVWMRIREEQLRMVDVQLVRELASSEPEARRVENDLSISFKVRGYGTFRYRLSDIPGVRVAGKVLVAVNLYRAPALDVQVVDADTGEEFWQTVAPIETNEYGFDVASPMFGEQPRQAANTSVDDNRNRVEREAFRTLEGLPSLEDAAKLRKKNAQAYAGVVDPMADVRATVVPAYMPRRSTALDAPGARTVVAQVLTVIEACKRLKTALGEAYTPQVYGWVSARFAEGVPEDQIDGICAQFTQVPHAAPQLTGTDGGLRVVGGAQ